MFGITIWYSTGRYDTIQYFTPPSQSESPTAAIAVAATIPVIITNGILRMTRVWIALNFFFQVLRLRTGMLPALSITPKLLSQSEIGIAAGIVCKVTGDGWHTQSLFHSYGHPHNLHVLVCRSIQWLVLGKGVISPHLSFNPNSPGNAHDLSWNAGLVAHSRMSGNDWQRLLASTY